MPADDDRLFIPITGKDGRVRGIMDQRTAEYLNSTEPNPDQKMLDAMLAKAVRVRVTNTVIEENERELKLLFETEDPTKIEELRKGMTLSDDPACGHCMCPGFPLLEFHDKNYQHLAAISFHHGYSIRWGIWKDDAELADGQRVLQWLAKNGVSKPLEDYIADQERSRKSMAETAAWLAAAPQCLVPLGDAILDDMNIAPTRDALALAYPKTDDRIRALLDWLGAGSGNYSGYPCYEQAPMNLLLEYPTKSLVNAVENEIVSARALSGARRLFACWHFKKRKDRDEVPAKFRNPN
jgi:hypothetical protein